MPGKSESNEESQVAAAAALDDEEEVKVGFGGRRELRGVPLMDEGSVFEMFTDPVNYNPKPSKLNASSALNIAMKMKRWQKKSKEHADHSKPAKQVNHMSRHAATLLAAKKAEEEARRVKLAAQLVQDAIEGRRAGLHQYKTNHSTAARLVLNHRAYIWTSWALLVWLMALAIFEPTEFPALNVPLWIPLSEVLVLVGCFVDVWVNSRAYGVELYTKFQKKWQVSFLAFTVLCLVDFVLHYILGSTFFRFSRSLRPFMLVAKAVSLRRLFAVMAKALPKLVDVMALFLALVVFFAVIGMQLFNDDETANLYADGGDGFNTFGPASLAIYILTSSENFPQIMWPALETRPLLSVLYFIPALFLFLWVALPTLLAIVYNTYLDMSNAARRKKQLRARQAVLCAYHVIYDDGTKALSYQLFHKLLKSLRPQYSPATTLKLFRVLDQDNSKKLSVREFLQLASLIRIQDKAELQLLKRFSGAATMPEPAGEAGTRTYKLRALARRIYSSTWFQYYRYMTVAGGLLTACAWNPRLQAAYDVCYEAFGAAGCTSKPVMLIYYFSLFGLLLLALELCVRIAACDGVMHADGLGQGAFFRSLANIFDLSVFTFCSVAQVWLAAGARYSLPPEIVDVLELSRGLLVLRVLSAFERYRSLISLLGGIIVIALRFTALYGCVTYSFAVVGMRLFADVAGAPMDNASEHYTFKTFGGACLALLQLTVGNDWNSVMYPNITDPNSTLWAGWFFVLYFSLCATLMFNVISGVIIDAYLEAVEAHAQQQNSAGGAVGDDDEEDEAEVDGSSPTGRARVRRIDAAATAAAAAAAAAAARAKAEQDRSFMTLLRQCFSSKRTQQNPAYTLGAGPSDVLSPTERDRRHKNAAELRKARMAANSTGQGRAGAMGGSLHKKERLVTEQALQRLNNKDRALPNRLLSMRKRLPAIDPVALADLRESLPEFENKLRREATEIRLRETGPRRSSIFAKLAGKRAGSVEMRNASARSSV